MIVFVLRSTDQLPALPAFTEDEGYMQTYKLFPHLFANESNLTLSEARQLLTDLLELFPDDATDELTTFYFGTCRFSEVFTFSFQCRWYQPPPRVGSFLPNPSQAS